MTADITKQFSRDIAEHAIEIIRNDGIYRHIRFSQPNTSCMHFDLITWPGYLCYTGDMGTYVFTRLHDMFEFFRRRDKSYSIDMRYWAEKCEAADGGRDVREFSYKKFQAYIRDWVSESEQGDRPDADMSDELARHTAAYAELSAAVEDEVTSADSNDTRCYDAANDFRHDGEAWREYFGPNATFEFSDLWDGFDHCTKEYTHRFQWCCQALAWGIEQFDKATAPAAEVAP